MTDDLETVTFRLAAWQRRRVVVQWLTLAAVAVGFTIAWQRFPDATVPLGTWAAGAWIVVAIGCYTTPVMLGAVTDCSPTGLSAETMGGPVELAWHDITSIALSTSPLSQTHRVRLTTRSGQRVHLVVPLSGRGVRSPEFFTDVETIDAYWRRAVGGGLAD